MAADRKNTRPTMTEVEQPLVAHLIELRDRLLRCLVAIMVVFLCLFPFANELFGFLAEPVMRHMPDGASMIATQVASPFLTPFKLALVLSFFAAIPVVLYQFWAFVAPGLYDKERSLVWPLLVSSVFLFYLGMAFAYYVVFPLVFGFFFKTAPEVAAVTPDIAFYLEFVLKLFFAFGLAFEVPIATILLVWVGATTPDKLATKRPYIIVGAFVIGMLLTPPDIISQTLLALPMWLLFEIGLFFSRMLLKRKAADSGEAEAPYEPQGAAAAVAPMPGGQADDYVPEGSEENAEDYRPMSEEDMDRELDRLEAEYAALEQDADDNDSDDGNDEKPEEKP